jgi:hypothetical protein
MTKQTPQRRRKPTISQREQLKRRALALKKRRAYRAAHRDQMNAAHLQWEHDNPERVARYRKKKNARRQRLRREARRLARRTTR